MQQPGALNKIATQKQKSLKFFIFQGLTWSTQLKKFKFFFYNLCSYLIHSEKKKNSKNFL